MQATTGSLSKSGPAQCGCSTSITLPHAPQAWNPDQTKPEKRAPGLGQPLATIRGAHRFRVRLCNGFVRTKVGPTSVPATPTCANADSRSVSSPVGRQRPVRDFAESNLTHSDSKFACCHPEGNGSSVEPVGFRVLRGPHQSESI